MTLKSPPRTLGTSMHPFGCLISVQESAAIPPIRWLLRLLDQYKLVLVRGMAALSRNEFLEYCRQAQPGRDPFLHWDFGPVMELTPSSEAKNYLFSRQAVPFHWDGAFHQVPSVLVFNCVEEPTAESGGETLFCDTEAVLARTPSELKKSWGEVSITYRTEKLAHYGGSVTVPLIQKHLRKRTEILRFAEPVNTELNPVFLDVGGVSAGEAARMTRYLSDRMYLRDVCYEHRWQSGDLLLADNFSLVHGRRAFTAEARRHLRRIQLV